MVKSLDQGHLGLDIIDFQEIIKEKHDMELYNSYSS